MASRALPLAGPSAIERCMEPMRLYRMCCHPNVAPGLTNYDLDKIAFVVLDPRNVVLMCGPAAAVFEWCAPGVYEVHAIVLPEGRGLAAIDAGKAFFALMVAEHRARIIWGGPPVSNRAVRWFARQVGMRPLRTEQRPNGLREILTWEPAK